MSRKTGRDVTPRKLENLMLELGPEVLCCPLIIGGTSIPSPPLITFPISQVLRSHGIWRTSFGPKLMPIVIVNRSYHARTCMANEESRENSLVCSCSIKGRESSRYFTSQAYNAGRHGSTQSEHKASCQLWKPPSTGHLHSWRRGFTEN